MRGRLVLEAHHTTRIEGTRLTLKESEVLLAGEAVPEADPDDVRELLNYRDAFEFVSTWLGSGGPVTEGLVREIHKRLVEGVRGGSAAPGEYRRIQNYVVNASTREVVYTPPPTHDVPILMRELVGWLNRERDIHPVLVSEIAQFQLDALVRQHALSARQAAALFTSSSTAASGFTTYERFCPGANRRTLQRDLKVLVGKGLSVDAGTGPTDPTQHYRLADGLERSGAEL